ncbi:helix-turn-helix domain-containing protein [Methylorubrum aminovorans]
MKADEFRAWRKELGLTQKEVASELGLSTLTVQQYERGFRHDNNRPVTIPKKIADACGLVTTKIRKKRGDVKLRHKFVSDEVRARVEKRLVEQRICINPVSALIFFSEHYDPFSDEIDEWLKENISKHGYAKFRVPDAEALGGSVVILHFFDQDDGFWFVMKFGGTEKER